MNEWACERSGSEELTAVCCAALSGHFVGCFCVFADLLFARDNYLLRCVFVTLQIRQVARTSAVIVLQAELELALSVVALGHV